MDWGLLALTLALTGYVWGRIAQLRRDEAARAQGREGLRRRIAQDPQNAGTHEALGDSLRAASELSEARDAYLAGLTAAGDGPLSSRIAYKLHQLDLDRHKQAAGQSGHSARPTPDLFFCRQCGGANDPARRVCENCGATLPYDLFRDALRDKEVLRGSLEAGACVMVLCAALWVADAQPIEVKGCLVQSTVIVGAWRILQAVGGRRM